MSQEEQPANDSEVQSGRELIQLGAESLAGGAGAAAGIFLGPPGALAGAAAGPALVRAIAWAGRTIKSRRLSHNEEVRIGTALYVALERIKEREEAGEQPRRDGFFDPATDPRGALEGALLSAARSYDEKKVPFIGAFYASFVLDEAVQISTAHFLLTLLDRLTYHHLCALAYFADENNDAERAQVQLDAEEGTIRASPTLLSELFELANLGLLGAWQGDPKEVRSFGETYATFGGGVPIVARSASLLALMPLGQSLVEMAELEKIPDADKKEIGAALRGASP
jgi:hypothetical protein